MLVTLLFGCLGELRKSSAEESGTNDPTASASCVGAPIQIDPQPAIEFAAFVQPPVYDDGSYLTEPSLGGDVVTRYYDLVNNCDIEQTVVVEFSHDDEGEALNDEYQSGWFNLDYNQATDSGAIGSGGYDENGELVENIASFRTTLLPYESMVRAITYSLFAEQSDPDILTYDYAVLHADVLAEPEDVSSASFHAEVGLLATVINMFAGSEYPDDTSDTGDTGGEDTGSDTGADTGSDSGDSGTDSGSDSGDSGETDIP